MKNMYIIPMVVAMSFNAQAEINFDGIFSTIKTTVAKVMSIPATKQLASKGGDQLPATHNWNDGSVDLFAKLVTEARAENKKAADLGFEWRDTVKFIDQAVKLKEAGKKDKAMDLIKYAKHQGILSQNQAKDQANAGPNF